MGQESDDSLLKKDLLLAISKLRIRLIDAIDTNIEDREALELSESIVKSLEELNVLPKGIIP
jgi:hypothetical protein